MLVVVWEQVLQENRILMVSGESGERKKGEKGIRGKVGKKGWGEEMHWGVKRQKSIAKSRMG